MPSANPGTEPKCFQARFARNRIFGLASCHLFRKQIPCYFCCNNTDRHSLDVNLEMVVHSSPTRVSWGFPISTRQPCTQMPSLPHFPGKRHRHVPYRKPDEQLLNRKQKFEEIRKDENKIVFYNFE